MARSAKTLTAIRARKKHPDLSGRGRRRKDPAYRPGPVLRYRMSVGEGEL
jgi:hypothetical protein